MSFNATRERVSVLDTKRGPGFYIVQLYEGRYKSTRVVTAIVFPNGGPVAMLDVDGNAIDDSHYKKIARAATTRADRKNLLTFTAQITMFDERSTR